MTANEPASFPGKNRVLIVDDESLILAALSATLSAEGYEVLATGDPTEALQIARTTPVSVVLTDQQMPGLTGLEFLSRVREIQPNATRILITGVVTLATTTAAINKGEVYRFIVKPWLREELIVSIQNAVQRYELISSNEVLQAETAAMNKRLATQLAQLDSQNRLLGELNQALQENLDHSVRLCVKSMETFYPLLGQQARRVFALCQAMAEGLGLPPEQRQVLEISGRLFDIGLVGIPRELIKKWQQTSDVLTEEERALIEMHPALGQEMVSFVAELEAVGSTIRAHHERFDGQGYPDRLSGEQIPWLARLLSVAVGYSAFPASEKAALEYVQAQSGVSFDPDAVRALERSLPQVQVPRSQRSVLLAELKPGMMLAQGIHTAYGILLIPEGQTLTSSHIILLRNHNRITPITQSLLVYC